MDQCKINEILTLISTHLFKECNELGKVNIAQIQTIINVLFKANIPFDMKFTEGTNNNAAIVQLEMRFTPTLTITKFFQLQEGWTGSRSLPGEI